MLPNQCALDIFSGFIDAIADFTKKIGGSTQREDGNHKETAGITNFVLHEIAEILVDYGLVNGYIEAYAIVIPPFARRGLLPKMLDVDTTTDSKVSGEDAGPSQTELEPEPDASEDNRVKEQSGSIKEDSAPQDVKSVPPLESPHSSQNE